MLDELRAASEPPVPFPLGYPATEFDALLARLDKDAKGIELPGNFVPSSTFWLVSRGAEIVGVSNLRHRLTPVLERRGGHIGYGVRPSARRAGFGRELLRLTLPHARELGLSRVLLTCGKGNLGSAKIILRCGGVLDSEEFLPEEEEIVQRYWIDLAIKS